jgi:hypothetical protein
MNNKTVMKFTITPVDVEEVDEHWQPTVTLYKDLTLEETSGLLTAKQFDLWRDFISRKDRDQLGAIRHALIHRFSGSLGQGKEDDDSRLFLHHAFICLRLVKPTKRPFQVIQGYLKQEGPEVYSFTSPAIEHINMPVTQTLNRIGSADVARLAELLPGFLFLSRPEQGPLYLQRAVRFYEQGYSATNESTLQFISWMIGIEAVISKGRPIDREELARTLHTGFGEIDIKELQWRNYFGRPRQPMLVGAQVENLLTLRDALVHAQPLPDSLRVMYPDYFGHEHELGAYLNAGAATILQHAILQEIARLGPQSR